MIRKRPFIYVGLSLILLLGLAACKQDISHLSQDDTLFDPLIETGRDVEMIYSEQGRMKINLSAPELVRHSDNEPYVEFPNGLTIIFYNDSLEVTSTLKANYGIRYEKKKETIFRDNVEIVNISGEQLQTEELVWDEEKAMIYSLKFVRIITPDERITGRGFTAKQDFTNYKITNITGGTINVDTGEDTEGP